MAQPPKLGVDLHEHDLVYGIVLPNLKEKYDSVTKKKEEYTVEQARAVDLRALPVRMNHNNEMYEVGATLAYRVRDDVDPPRAETIFQLNREPDVPVDDWRSRTSAQQRNLLMEGAHRGMSLGHNYRTDYVGNCGMYLASASGVEFTGNPDPYGDPGRVVHKEAKEISLCDRGLREGSEIIEYLPCRRSLQRSDDGAVRRFTEIYNYTPPPAGLTRRSAGWSAYIDTLDREVRERRQRVLTENGYSELLRANGAHSASADRLQRKLLKDVPWIFLPHLETQGIGRFNPFTALAREQERANRCV